MNLTTTQAAALVGMAPSVFRGAMTRARARGVDCRCPRGQWPDARTPLWDEAALQAWMATRGRQPAG